MLLNYGFYPGFDVLTFLPFLKSRKNRRQSLIVFLTSEGGDPDCAYRVGRYMQGAYNSITAVVAGWCKSAGTLVCIAANDIVMCDAGELGPLDVQISKLDEVGERSSGLAIDAAFEKLQKESAKLLMRYLESVMNETPGRISFKMAADIASHMVTGMMSPIFGKIDPLAVGEDYRANLIAEQYAIRLNLKSRNLREGETSGLTMLTSGYPSHRFVIDRSEASRLFQRVTGPKETLKELVGILSTDVMVPRNPLRNEEPRLEYINDEATPPAAASVASATGRKSRAPVNSPRAGAGKLRRNISARTQQTARPSSASSRSARPNGPDR